MQDRRKSSRRLNAPATLLIGAGRMGSALLKGWAARGLGPIVAVEPKVSRALRVFAAANRIALLSCIDNLGDIPIAACVVALKPQVLNAEAALLRPIARSGALMVSIAAGTSVETLRRAWGRGARIVRAMPNTPGAIGRGISALFAPPGPSPADRRRAEMLLSVLGQTVWVTREELIDIVTAVSGSGPAYVFLLVEVLALCAEEQGLPRRLAQRLARATVSGAGALLDADPRPPSELRHDVTSPGGTTEAALAVLLANNAFKRLLAAAVKTARARSAELRV